MNNQITVITCDKNWMEHSAFSQLEGISKLPGVVRVVGLPDLHAGRTPVGIALETQDIIYPHLIGNDIGCGMGLFSSGIKLNSFKEKRWVSRLNNIRELGDIISQNRFDEDSPFDDLGTIGGGNHFVEFQKVREVFDQQSFSTLGMPENEIAILVHSGSRGYGSEIFKTILGVIGLHSTSSEAQAYMQKHDHALLWAGRNREVVAEKLVTYLGYDSLPKRILDFCHNYIEAQNERIIHRKGAVSAQNGIVVIPGSRGSLTYLVKPAEDTEYSAFSLSHGAGRKWARSLCKSRIKDKYDRQSIRETTLKSKVVCHDTELLYQEAPEAYKNVEHIITALLEHKLIAVVATLQPLITYKG